MKCHALEEIRSDLKLVWFRPNSNPVLILSTMVCGTADREGTRAHSLSWYPSTPVLWIITDVPSYQTLSTSNTSMHGHCLSAWYHEDTPWGQSLLTSELWFIRNLVVSLNASVTYTAETWLQTLGLRVSPADRVNWWSCDGLNPWTLWTSSLIKPLVAG